MLSAAALVALGACAGPVVSTVPAPEPGSSSSAGPTPSPSATPPVTPSTEPTPPRTTTAPRKAKAGPLGAPGPWKLDWREEFSGRSLDLDRWRPNWLANTDGAVTKPINQAERSCYDPANVAVRNGTLRLTAEERRCRTHDGRTYRYASGLVESAHDHTFTYGFVEARIHLPPADGTLAPAGSCGPNWAVFWLNGRHHPEDGEIDVMECLSQNDVSWHYHAGTEADPRTEGGYPTEWQGDMPGTGGWHTFGVDWSPDRIVYYFDGVPVGTVTGDIPDRPHYIVAALAISGTAVAVPQTMQVDYVRVWKRAGQRSDPG